MSQNLPWDEPGRAGYEAARAPGAMAVRERFDAGLLELTGRDRQTFLQGMVSNDVLSLTPGASVRAALLDTTAHILADLTVYCLPDSLVLATDKLCLDRAARALDKYLIMEKVRIRDVSSEWSLISVLGEGAAAGIGDALRGSEGLSFSHSLGDRPGQDALVPSATVSEFQANLLAGGAVSLTKEAWETLRVEAGIPAWGHELDESVLLPEAGLEDAVSYTKGCYVGQEIVARIAARGHANRGLRSILLAEGEAVPTPGDTLHLPEEGPDAGREIGRITSAVRSPRFDGRALALGYVRREHFAPGTPVSVHLRQPGGAVFAAPGVVRTVGSER